MFHDFENDSAVDSNEPLGMNPQNRPLEAHPLLHTTKQRKRSHDQLWEDNLKLGTEITFTLFNLIELVQTI